MLIWNERATLNQTQMGGGGRGECTDIYMQILLKAVDLLARHRVFALLTTTHVKKMSCFHKTRYVYVLSRKIKDESENLKQRHAGEVTHHQQPVTLNNNTRIIVHKLLLFSLRLRDALSINDVL